MTILVSKKLAASSKHSKIKLRERGEKNFERFFKRTLFEKITYVDNVCSAFPK